MWHPHESFLDIRPAELSFLMMCDIQRVKIRSVLVPLLTVTLQGDGIRPCVFTSTLQINSSCNQYSVIRYLDQWWTAAVISCLRGCGVGCPHKHSTQKCSKSISLLWVYVVKMCRPDTSVHFPSLIGVFVAEMPRPPSPRSPPAALLGGHRDVPTSREMWSLFSIQWILLRKTRIHISRSKFESTHFFFLFKDATK